MNRNLSELEQRLITILKDDSRKSISEIAQELEVSRTTARKTMDSLLESGRIKSFTIQLDDDEKDLVLVHLEDSGPVPRRYVLEDFELIGGTHVIVMHYENLVKLEDLKIMEVRIARRRYSGESQGRISHIHCDLCGNEILRDPITLRVKGKTYYACCPNCEKTLGRRLAEMENQ